MTKQQPNQKITSDTLPGTGKVQQKNVTLISLYCTLHAQDMSRSSRTQVPSPADSPRAETSFQVAQ